MIPYSGEVEVNGQTIAWETTFDQSMKFKCSMCGYSCTASNVEISKTELLRIENLGKTDFYEDFANEEGKISKRFKGSDKDACLFLDEVKKCTIYSSRPSVCRLFPFKIVPISENKVKIDVTYGCKSMMNKNFSSENEVDYSEMVKTFMSHEFLGGKESYQAEALHSMLKDKLDKPHSVKDCWNSAVTELKNMEYFEQFWDVLDSFEKERSKIQGTLRRSNDELLISNSLKEYRNREFKQEPFYNPKLFFGSHSRPYQSLDFSNDQCYYFSITGEYLKFKKGNEERTFLISEIAKRKLSPLAKIKMHEYYWTIWDRQATKQKLEMHFLEKKTPSFGLMVSITKKKVLLLQFFMDAISHYYGETEISERSVKEAIMPFDLIFCYMKI